jgi:hypothetical protein
VSVLLFVVRLAFLAVVVAAGTYLIVATLVGAAS